MARKKSYRRADERPGSGRQVLYITAQDGSSVQLKTLNEQLKAAQIIQAQMLLGASRSAAEAVAAEKILQTRRARRWFGL